MTSGNPAAGAHRQGKKSPSAFRTIAEVASDLALPAHVLRFWESKFPQIRPLKRRGGRRYYRPEDVALLRRISGLLYTDGYTIKGVQRLLRENPRAGSEDASESFAEEPADEAFPDEVGSETLAESESDEESLETSSILAASPTLTHTDFVAVPRSELQALVDELRAVVELLTRSPR